MPLHISTKPSIKSKTTPNRLKKTIYLGKNSSKESLIKICYSHPLGNIILTASKRIVRNEFGDMIAISLPYMRFLDKSE